MRSSDIPRAVDAAKSTAIVLGLEVDEAVILQESNRLAIHLLPCDVLARVAQMEHQGAAFEVDMAQQLTEAVSPVAVLDPRVEPRTYPCDNFVITFWTYYEPKPPHEVSPSEFAQVLAQLHAGMRKVRVPAPHFTDRVAEAQRLIDDPSLSPELEETDRALLSSTLRRFGRSVSEHDTPDQLLHGEPHPGNLLRTNNGLLFIDLETCCYGPVEFDIAHAPDEVADHYPNADQALLRACRILMLAMIVAWRWDRDDQLPNGRQLGREWLEQLRQMLNSRE